MAQQLAYLDSVVNMPIMPLPVRSVLVCLKEAQILISPGSQLQAAQYRALPKVTDIVAPNLLHCGGVPSALKEFPQARVWGAERANTLKPHIRWTHKLSRENWIYQEELPLIEIRGAPSLCESAFFHKVSKTLIVCDLAFNLRNPKGLGTWIILHLFGSYDKFAVSRFYMQSVKDRVAFTNSMREIFSYDFENISMSHGQHVQGGGKDLLRAALAERNILI